MSEREEAALKCAQHIIKIKRTHSDYRDSWLGGESNLATEFMLLRQRVQTAERERDEARRERDAKSAVLASVELARAEAVRVAQELRHRAERAERVVEAVRVFFERTVTIHGETVGKQTTVELARLYGSLRALDASGRGDG